MTATAPTPSLAGLVDGLTRDGVLPEGWREAFLSVPREVFIPDVIWRYAGDDLVPLRRWEDPEEWLRWVYGPRYIVTQVDDGAPIGPDGRGRVPTSSASRPDIVALMLDAGCVESGMRVCEIGTGTGYTAALLAHRLGPQQVTTIEVDPELAERARVALSTAGYGGVTVLTGDGALGCPEGAPFDRVLSTVAAPWVPYPWVAQTRPGGLVVTPWGSAYKPAGLLSLTVGDDGTATGCLVNTGISFMPLRDQRVYRPPIGEIAYDTDIPEVRDTEVHAARVCNDDAPFAIGLRVPGCQYEFQRSSGDDGRWCMWFLDPDSRSWARFDYEPDVHPHRVVQFGPRRLWDEVEAAYRWWRAAGAPKATDWRFWVTPDGLRVEANGASMSRIEVLLDRTAAED